MAGQAQAPGGVPTPAINQAPIVGNPTQGIRNQMYIPPGGSMNGGSMFQPIGGLTPSPGGGGGNNIQQAI